MKKKITLEEIAAQPTIGAPPTDQELARHAEPGRQQADDKKRKAPKRAPGPAKKAGKVSTPASAKKAATAPKKATAAKPAPVAKPAETGTKKDQVLGLISRKDGATLDEIMAAMGWQRHTVRGFISILGKAGTKIQSSKSETGARTYKAA